MFTGLLVQIIITFIGGWYQNLIIVVLNVIKNVGKALPEEELQLLFKKMFPSMMHMFLLMLHSSSINPSGKPLLDYIVSVLTKLIA